MLPNLLVNFFPSRGSFSCVVNLKKLWLPTFLWDFIPPPSPHLYLAQVSSKASTLIEPPYILPFKANGKKDAHDSERWAAGGKERPHGLFAAPARFSHQFSRSLQILSLVPRPLRSIRVSKGGLEASATSANFLTSLTVDVASKIAEDD